MVRLGSWSWPPQGQQGKGLSCHLTLTLFFVALTLLTMLGVISRAIRRPEWGGGAGGSGRERVSLSEVQDLTWIHLTHPLTGRSA